MDSMISFPSDRPDTKLALVIEDDPTIREGLAFHLQRTGYSPLTFSNAEVVLRLLDALRVDIMIVDLILPGLVG